MRRLRRVVGGEAAEEVRPVALARANRLRARDQRFGELLRAPEVVADDRHRLRAGQVDVDVGDAVAAAHAADRIGIGGAGDEHRLDPVRDQRAHRLELEPGVAQRADDDRIADAAARASFSNACAMPLKKRLSWSGMIMPISPERLVRRPLAWRLTRERVLRRERADPLRGVVGDAALAPVAAQHRAHRRRGHVGELRRGRRSSPCVRSCARRGSG